MNCSSKMGLIQVQGINLWSHVGVLEEEQLLGQYFLLDFSVYLDISEVIEKDRLDSTIDYSIPIVGLKKLAFESKSMTIEKFSQDILDFLENLYGTKPIKILLTKCEPPIKGFTGKVSISRTRNFDFE